MQAVKNWCDGERVKKLGTLRQTKQGARWYSLFSIDIRKKIYSFRNIAKNDLAGTVRSSSGLRGNLYTCKLQLYLIYLLFSFVYAYIIKRGLQELHLYWHYDSDCNHPGQAEDYMMMSPWIRTLAFFMRMLTIYKQINSMTWIDLDTL
jgi:hypothetical protein